MKDQNLQAKIAENNKEKVVYIIDYVYFRSNKNADVKMVNSAFFSQKKHIMKPQPSVLRHCRFVQLPELQSVVIIHHKLLANKFSAKNIF